MVAAYPALGSVPYRWLLLATLTSELGLYAFETTLFWTALEAGDTAALVGVLYAALIVPMLLLTVPVGVATDRFGPRRLMLGTSTAAALVIAVAAIVVGSGRLETPVAIGLALAEGAFFGLWAVPAQILATRLVDQRHVASAVGLALFPAGIGSIVGGALGGIALALGGPQAALALSGASVAISVGCIAAIPHLPGLDAGARTTATRGLRDAFAVIRSTPAIRAVVFLGAVAALTIMSRFAIFPSLARDVVAGGPAALGFFVSASGVGAMLGALLGDPLGRRLGRGRVLIGGLLLSGSALALAGSSTWLAVSLVLVGLVTVGLVASQVTAAAIVQLLAPPRMRGRVVATSDLLRLSLVPLGGIAAGNLVDVLGASGVALMYGGVAILGALGVALRARWVWRLAVEAPDQGGAPVAIDGEPPGG